MCEQEEEFVDTKRVIRIRKSTKDRQHLQNIIQKTKDRVTQTPLKTNRRVNSDAPEGYAVPAPLVTPVVALKYTHPVLHNGRQYYRYLYCHNIACRLSFRWLVFVLFYLMDLISNFFFQTDYLCYKPEKKSFDHENQNQ